MIWYNAYPSPYHELFYSICGAHNGGFVAAGYYDSSTYTPWAGIVTYVDNQGKLIWEKILNYNEFHISEFSSICKINGGYLLCPRYYVDTTIYRGRAEIIKLDTSGNITFSKIIPQLPEVPHIANVFISVLIIFQQSKDIAP